MNAKLEWQEVDVEGGRLSFADFDLLRNEQVLGSLLHCSLVFRSLFAGLLSFIFLLRLVKGLVLLVLDLDVEQYFLIESVVNWQFYCRCFVQLGSYLSHID